MLLYNFTLQGHEVNWDNLHGFFSDYCGFTCWPELSFNERVKPKHSRLIGKFYGINVWYDFGADYFYFEEIPT